MRKIIEGWRHELGRHCASTALRDAMLFWGRDVSEAMCFGLGRGIGSFYVSTNGFSPSRWVMTRGQDLELRFFNAIGVPFSWKQAPDAQTAWAKTKSDIDAGLPVLLQTDLHFLDYYNTKTHFNRHAVLLWGYDEEKGIGFLSDTDKEGLIEIPLESLSKARSSPYPPGPVQFDWFAISDPGKLNGLRDAGLKAMKQNALELSTVPKNFPLKMGLNALEALAQDLPNWKEAQDWSWSSRFAYQAIEKRGTGGGAFRKMYAEFIAEVEELAPEIKSLGLSKLMKEIAATWTDFAYALKKISENIAPTGFEEAQTIAQRLFRMEKEWCNRTLQID